MPEGRQLNATYIVPSITQDDAALVRSLLADAGANVTYIIDAAIARKAVADIRASQPEVIGFDVETEVIGMRAEHVGQFFFAGLPFTFHVLNHENFEAVAQRPPSEAKGTGGFPFAVAGNDHD